MVIETLLLYVLFRYHSVEIQDKTKKFDEVIESLEISKFYYVNQICIKQFKCI